MLAFLFNNLIACLLRDIFEVITFLTQVLRKDKKQFDQKNAEISSTIKLMGKIENSEIFIDCRCVNPG